MPKADFPWFLQRFPGTREQSSVNGNLVAHSFMFENMVLYWYEVGTPTKRVYDPLKISHKPYCGWLRNPAPVDRW